MTCEELKFAYLASRRAEPDPSTSATALSIHRELRDSGGLSWKVVGEYKATGKSSRSLVVYEDPSTRHSSGRVVEKILTPGDGPMAAFWLDEALFYDQIRDRVQVSGIHIPRCLGIHVVGRDQVRIYLEHCGNFRPMRNLAERGAAAHAFGRLAAFSQKHGLHKTEWLRQDVGVGQPAPPTAFGHLLDAIARDDREAQAMSTAILEFYGNRSALNAEYRQCSPTLTHGDANHLNVLIRDGEPPVVLTVDWARVASGMMGDDLARLILPWAVTDGPARGRDELLDMEAGLLDRYTAGLGLNDLPSAVRFAYEVKSVTLTLGIAQTFLNWRATRASLGRPNDREGSLHAWVRIIAERASRLLAEHGSRSASSSGRQA